MFIADYSQQKWMEIWICLFALCGNPGTPQAPRSGTPSPPPAQRGGSGETDHAHNPRAGGRLADRSGTVRLRTCRLHGRYVHEIEEEAGLGLPVPDQFDVPVSSTAIRPVVEKSRISPTQAPPAMIR
jgi:hypothetical protein